MSTDLFHFQVQIRHLKNLIRLFVFFEIHVHMFLKRTIFPLQIYRLIIIIMENIS